MTDGEVIDRIERAEPFAKKLHGAIEAVAAGPCADAQAAGLRRIAYCVGDVPRDLAEAALAHSLNATEGAYRRMTAVERRREVMTRYADWLNDERGKVLAFPTGKTV